MFAMSSVILAISPAVSIISFLAVDDSPIFDDGYALVIWLIKDLLSNDCCLNKVISSSNA